jgi:hypothetical protein
MILLITTCSPRAAQQKAKSKTTNRVEQLICDVFIDSAISRLIQASIHCLKEHGLKTKMENLQIMTSKVPV